MNYDVIVVGKGPAGISCAIYLKRYGYQVLVIAKDGGALEKVASIENYYGFTQISGKELLMAGEQQAHHLGIEIIEEEVVSIEKLEQFHVTTDKKEYVSQRVVLACGTARSRFPLIDSFKNVSYCATCDGFFYRNKKVAIIGNGTYMMHELSVLKQICKEVIVFTNGQPLNVDIKDTLVIKDKIEKAEGDSSLTEIIAGNEKVLVDGCFIAIGCASGFTLAKHLGLALEGNFLKVNAQFETNLKGLYACGDAVGGLLQVSKAVGEGASCAEAISKAIKEHK